MTVLKVIKNHLISSLFTSLELSKKNKINFFSIFKIRFFYAFPFIRNLIGIKKSYQNILNETYFENKLDKNKIIHDISKKGFFKTKVNSHTINSLINQIEKGEFIYKFKNPLKNFDQVFQKGLTLKDIIDTSKEKNISHLMLSFNQNSSNIYNSIAKSEFFISIAKTYLNSKNVMLRTHCYISNPIETDEVEQKNNAQFYHYDCDYKKFLKIFLYLTDVDIGSGPHTFIPFSHQKKKLIHVAAERMDNKVIDHSYKEYGKETFIGDKGTIIFEDTFGFHKGEIPKSKSRAMLIFEYGIPPRIDIDGNEIIL